jgi:Fur family ferric uptake transcriptional regulator
MHDLRRLMDRVQEQGWRITRQRAITLQALCELDHRAGAEEIHERVIVHRCDVELSTIYRTLERLRDLHIVSQTDLGHGRAEFEIIDDPLHHHLVCTHCGRIEDLAHTYFDSLTATIRKEVDFIPSFDHMSIFGVCRACTQDGIDQSVAEDTDSAQSVPKKEEQT